MFQVVIPQLQDGCTQIEQHIRTLSYMAEELRTAITAVSSFSGMGDIAQQLRQQMLDIQEEEAYLRQMLQILNKVLMSYIKCENNNIDEFEQNNYFYMARDMGTFELHRVSSLIK